MISSLPNLALDDVPVGKDDSMNKEIIKVGEIPQISPNFTKFWEIWGNPAFTNDFLTNSSKLCDNFERKLLANLNFYKI